MNFLVIFLTGLTTGGLSCLAMQGGLLASVIANQKKDELGDTKATNTKFNRKLNKQSTAQFNNLRFPSLDKLDWMPVGMFLLAKLVAHMIVGFLLGLLGSVVTFSLEMRLVFQSFTALFMLATALNLLQVHPIFRYVFFQPPKFLQKIIKNSKNSRALFAPAVLGLLTVFVPCGVTQAMEVLAINSGSPIIGMLTMLFFVLGTMPLFAVLGVATAKLSESWHQKFSKIAAYTLIAMAIYSINGVLLVVNSPLTLNKVVSPIKYFFSEERFGGKKSQNVNSNQDEFAGAEEVDGVQKVTIRVANNGYVPNYLRVKNGIPVELTLESNNTYSCALAFVFREFNINTFLEKTDKRSFTFTPNKKGKFTFSCSMGMYSGVMEVI